MIEWAPDFLAKCEAWAAALGCVALWGHQTRKGWLRIVKQYGGIETAQQDFPAWEKRIAHG